MKKSRIAQLISIIFKIMLGLGTIILFFVPTFYDIFSQVTVDKFNNQTFFYKFAFYLCAITGLAIVYQLVKIFNNVYKGSPFNKSMIINLKIIAVLFMVLSLIILIKIIFLPTVISIAVFLIAFIVSLSFYVLSQIFKAAVKYKDEVDYTI